MRTHRKTKEIDMPSLQDLLDRKAALEKEIETTRKQERTEAIAKVKALMSQYGLSVADLSIKSAPKASGSGKGRKVAVKYRNAATGDTWSGRGLQPKWLKAAVAAGRKVEEFAVK
jgi:DNA-binding protein H-NS